MHRTSWISSLLVLALALPGFAEKAKTSDPILSASPGKSIVGRTLPPGTYRVVPELGSGQNEASVRVTLVAVDSGKPKTSEQPKTGMATVPIKTDTPQTGPQKQQPGDPPDSVPPHTTPVATPPSPAQDLKQTGPSGTGPEYDCEYGLPRRDGADCELQLTPGDLPAGFHLDDLANFNKACEVHQWIMHGPDRRNRVELSISAWGARAAQYYDWKHGMLGTGEFEHTDLSVGTKELYVEEKAECNKQLIMQAGNYLVEMHRPGVEGVTQQADPISRQKFVALAKACEARIAAVAGIPDKAMLDDNPAEFRWRNIVWPARFENGTLKVRGAGINKWGTQWVVVDSGIQSYRGQGTGAGPVVSYTKDGKRWTIVTLDHETGARGNVRAFDTRVSILKAGEYGATLRIGGTCYDYSWNHLEEIDCETGQFIHASKGNQSAGVEEPVKVPQPSIGQEPGTPAKPEVKPEVQPPASLPLPPRPDYPDWVWDLDLEILAGDPPEPGTKYSSLTPCWLVDPDDFVPFKLVDRKTGQEFSATFDVDTKPACGVFNGQVFHAIGVDLGSIKLTSVTINYIPKGGTRQKREIINYDCRKNKRTEWVHVNPPLKVKAGEWPPDHEYAVLVRAFYKDSAKPVEGVRVVIQGDNTPEIELGTTTDSGSVGWLTYENLRAQNIPRGIYSVYAYKRDDNLAKDLWAAEEYKIALPPAKGTSWELRIFMTETGKKWNKFNLDEVDKKLNQ